MCNNENKRENRQWSQAIVQLLKWCGIVMVTSPGIYR